MISRELYRKVKSMSKEEMNNYLNDLYNKGYNSGFNAGCSTLSKSVTDKIDAGIRKTPGVGEKRYKMLMDNITSEMTGEPVQSDIT